MTENGKELLELAAKAAGIKGEWCAFFGITGHGAGQKQFGIGDPAVFTWGADRLWNPLEDDGDALRLAVKLGLDVYGRNIGCSVDEGDFFDEADFGGDYFKAARYAIVSRAAEIGKDME